MTPAEKRKLYAPVAHGDILIVDDVDDNIDILRRHLISHEYSIEYVKSGDEALQYVSRKCPDLVLLDWMMPRMSGLETLAKIREKYSASHLPVIMVTALSEADCVVDAFAYGANDYIVKPFDPRIVLARVKSQIERLQAIRALEGLMIEPSRAASFEAKSFFGQAAVVRDAIAARKAAEESLREALKKAEGAARAKKAFLSNMSHELKTPLNAIIGFSEILMADGNDQQKSFLSHINKSGEHLLSIIESLIRMSELEQDQPALERSIVKAASLVRDAVDVLRYSAGEKGVDLNCEATNDEMELFCDGVALKQALINIISNAIKFSPEGGVVDVSVRQDSADRLAFVVTDSGVGFQTGVLERMGEPFERGDFDYEGCYDGVGVGLAIAKRLVEAHGGQILFRDRESQGTEVTVIVQQSTVNYLKQ